MSRSFINGQTGGTYSETLVSTHTISKTFNSADPVLEVANLQPGIYRIKGTIKSPLTASLYIGVTGMNISNGYGAICTVSLNANIDAQINEYILYGVKTSLSTQYVYNNLRFIINGSSSSPATGTVELYKVTL
ncbi:MAG: hypothetical protein FWG88_04985 [Oscillospiraceae bacterium]|nr:hypothetical protein [Oscillospiraceae bacterium]